MKLKIITLHSIYNPGSTFQALGLQNFLIESGYETKIIDYRPYYSTIGKNKIKGIARKIIYYKNEKKLKHKYETFIKNNMLLTNKRYRNYSALKKMPPQADCFIAGSDQLWNLDYDCGNDSAYYLQFVKEGKKISYATSLGKKQIPTNELKFIQSRISDFQMVSVREKSSSDILSEKMGKNVFWVCDPVFLLRKEFYDKMTKRPFGDKYVVIYLSVESDLLNSIVSDIKERKGYKVVLMGGNVTRCECDYHVKDLGPIDFLSLIKYAEIVISSSFHATAFSHIFHKKFGAILPEGNGERIESLVKLSGLTDHIINCEKDIQNIYSEIEYENVDCRMNSFVEKSKKILINAIENR